MSQSLLLQPVPDGLSVNRRNSGELPYGEKHTVSLNDPAGTVDLRHICHDAEETVKPTSQRVACVCSGGNLPLKMVDASCSAENVRCLTPSSSFSVKNVFSSHLNAPLDSY